MPHHDLRLEVEGDENEGNECGDGEPQLPLVKDREAGRDHQSVDRLEDHTDRGSGRLFLWLPITKHAKLITRSRNQFQEFIQKMLAKIALNAKKLTVN